jgi:uncharacterized membrane protein (DUF106 family)
MKPTFLEWFLLVVFFAWLIWGFSNENVVEDNEPKICKPMTTPCPKRKE